MGSVYDPKSQKVRLAKLITSSRRITIALRGSCNVNIATLNSSEIADYLLAKGVVLFPCRIGDTVYAISHGVVYEVVVYSFWITEKDFRFCCKGDVFTPTNFPGSAFGKTVFLTREEAQMALEQEVE